MNKSGHTTKELIANLRKGIIYRDVARRSVNKPATDRLMEEAADMIEHLLNSRQDMIHRFQGKPSIDWITDSRMLLRTFKNLLGEPVEIEWMPDKGEWPNFRVLKVYAENELVELQGINTEYGTHDGSKIIVPIEEVRAVRPLE